VAAMESSQPTATGFDRDSAIVIEEYPQRTKKLSFNLGASVWSDGERNDD